MRHGAGRRCCQDEDGDRRLRCLLVHLIPATVLAWSKRFFWLIVSWNHTAERIFSSFKKVRPPDATCLVKRKNIIFSGTVKYIKNVSRASMQNISFGFEQSLTTGLLLASAPLHMMWHLMRSHTPVPLQVHPDFKLSWFEPKLGFCGSCKVWFNLS